jgi:tetratricopeptide (TPR) repeat protein
VKGNYEDAISCYLRAIELSGGSKDFEAGLAACYAHMGKREEAIKILNELVAYSQADFVSSVDIAVVSLALGEKDQALARLERAFRERDPFLLEIGLIDYRFDPIRSDPRFTDLLKGIGLKK